MHMLYQTALGSSSTKTKGPNPWRRQTSIAPWPSGGTQACPKWVRSERSKHNEDNAASQEDTPGRFLLSEEWGWVKVSLLFLRR